MSVFLQNTKLTGISQAALRVLLANELGNNDASAFKLSYAGSGSGYSIGLAQLDFTAKTGGAQTLFQNSLQAAGYSPQLALSISNAVTAAGQGTSATPPAINLSGLSFGGQPVTLASINAALNSPAAQAKIVTDADDEVLAAVTNVTAAVNGLTNTTMQGELTPTNANFNPTAFLQLVDYSNQFGGISINGPMYNLINTGTTTFPNGGTAYSLSPGTPLALALGVGELNTLYGQSGGTLSLLNRVNNVQQIGSEYSGQNVQAADIIDNQGTFSINAFGLGGSTLNADLSAPVNGVSSATMMATTSGSAQISFDLGASPTTTVTATDASGASQTLNMSGLATVLNATTLGGTATATGSTPTILIGADNSNLTGMAAGDIFINLGSGSTITTGASATVIDEASNVTINNTGGLCFDGANCNQVLVNGNGEFVTLGNGSSSTVTGNNDGITAGAGSTVDAIGNTDTITGGANDTITDTGTNDTDTLGAGSSITDTASGASLTVNGSNLTVTLAGASESANVFGNGDTTSAGSTDFTGTFGNNDVLNASGGSASFTGTNDRGNLSNTTISEGINTTLNVVGNGDTTNAGATDATGTFGNSDVLNATGGSASFTGTNDRGNLSNTTISEGANTSLTVVGNGDATWAGATDSTGTFGNSDMLTATGGAATFTGTGDTGYLTGTTISEGANTSLNVVGNGDATWAGATDSTGTFGNSDVLNANNETINTLAGDLNKATGGTGDYLGLMGSTGDSVAAANDNTQTMTLLAPGRAA
jgi:hypothetical protein